MSQEIEEKENKLAKKFIKPVTMNLCNDPMPPRHKDLLDLGPKFVPTSNIIPYKDIVTVTEATALKFN